MTITRFIACALFAAALQLPATAGTLYFSEDNSGVLYTLSTTTGAPTNIGASGVTSSTVGLSPSALDTLLYGSQWFNILEIQADGSGAAVLGGADAEGMAFDGGTGTLYGAINGAFFTISTATGAVATNLAAPGADIEGLAFGNGLVYGLAGFSGPRGNLYSYNPGLDSWTFIAHTGVDFNLPGLAYDAGLNVLYAKGSQDSFLYSINPVTGVATPIGDTGIGNGGGLAFVGASVIPEPSTLALLGLGGLALRRRRRRA